jgi:hypothetical protein
VICDGCGHEAAALKTVRPRARPRYGGASFVRCDPCWRPVAVFVWVVPGRVICFGTCRGCGEWHSVRDLAAGTLRGGGRHDAPTGICPGCF